MQWEWNPSLIRKTVWDTTFRRGWRAWLALVAVGFVFAFVGASNASQLSFVDAADRALGTSDIMLPHNVAILNTYFDNIAAVRDLPLRSSELAQGFVDSLSKSATWVIRLLALNPRYFAANPGEVWANVIIVALITIALRFLVQNVIVVGQHRYVMETRFTRKVPWRRMLAPFHLSTLPNVAWVMICYHVTLLLWALTIVGGFYKAYQYAMVPYLVAENPRITWGEARALSTRMTDGYKRRMLVVHLSYLPIFLLQAVPVLGLLVVVPLEAELGAELYFTLRGNPALDRELFVEPAFDGVPYVLRPADERAGSAPAYLLADLDIERPHAVRGPLPYPVVDLVYCFFAFCCAGWVWEVALHFVQEHEWVNRGTLYGPWIPIYGVGGVGIIVLLDRYRKSPERLFFLAMALCAVLEYVCSWLLDFMFNTSYWDYDGMLFNVNGRICLAGLLAFGLGGLFGVYVAAPAISRKVGEWPQRVRYGVAAALVAAFCGDLGYCVLHGFNSGSGVGERL